MELFNLALQVFRPTLLASIFILRATFFCVVKVFAQCKHFIQAVLHIINNIIFSSNFFNGHYHHHYHHHHINNINSEALSTTETETASIGSSRQSVVDPSGFAEPHFFSESSLASDSVVSFRRVTSPVTLVNRRATMVSTALANPNIGISPPPSSQASFTVHSTPRVVQRSRAPPTLWTPFTSPVTVLSVPETPGTEQTFWNRNASPTSSILRGPATLRQNRGIRKQVRFSEGFNTLVRDATSSRRQIRRSRPRPQKNNQPTFTHSLIGKPNLTTPHTHPIHCSPPTSPTSISITTKIVLPTHAVALTQSFAQHRRRVSVSKLRRHITKVDAARRAAWVRDVVQSVRIGNRVRGFRQWRKTYRCHLRP